MGLTFNLGRVSPSVFTDSSLNVGIGAAPSGSYKLEVTGTAKVSSTLLVSGAATFSSSITANAASIINGLTQDAIQTIFTIRGYNASSQLKALYFQFTGSTPLFTMSTGAVGTDAGIAIRPDGNNGLIIPYGTGAATFSSSVTAGGKIFTSASVADNIIEVINSDTTNGYGLYVRAGGTATNRYVARFKNGADSDVMWVGNNGNVGIGSTAPSAKLEITNSPANDWGLSVTANTTSGQSYGGIVRGGTTSGDVAFRVNNALNNTVYFTVRGDGILLSLPTVSYTTSASANLNMGAAGDFRYSTASSQRYKDNIEDWVGSGLDTILALKPRTFNYKESYYSNPDVKMLGLIAEEVAEVSPYLADYENEDRTGQVENVRYANIVVPLIAAIKELSAQNQDLKSRLDKAGL